MLHKRNHIKELALRKNSAHCRQIWKAKRIVRTVLSFMMLWIVSNGAFAQQTRIIISNASGKDPVEQDSFLNRANILKENWRVETMIRVSDTADYTMIIFDEFNRAYAHKLRSSSFDEGLKRRIAVSKEGTKVIVVVRDRELNLAKVFYLRGKAIQLQGNEKFLKRNPNTTGYRMVMNNKGKMVKTAFEKDPEGTIWVQNGKGKRIDAQDTVVSRTFFAGNMRIQTTTNFGSNPSVLLLYCSSDGKWESMFSAVPILNNSFFDELRKMDSGTIWMLVLRDSNADGKINHQKTLRYKLID